MSSTSSGSTTINSTLLIFIVIVAVAFAAVIIMYLILKKRSQNSDVARIENLRKGTEQKTFSSDVLYQKLYVRYLKIPFIKMYLLKIRRRLEINNLDDEFTTRLQTSKIITRALLIIIPLTVVLVWITHTNLLLMFIVLVFEIFIIDTITDSMVNKLDNDLLLQQIDFFAKMRHAYHETNMVAEAIYQTAQESDYVEISRQAEQIYNILNSADPETELEKYYDIAPNNFIKEFAGISYLTQEFGDRKTDNTSLYLTNLENITQEMQLEILKRDKLNYIFQSLSFIAIAPTILLEPIRKWSISNFSFTKSFYNGKQGMYVQILIMVVTFICYTLVRKLKDNGSTKIIENNQNPWEEKLYKKKFFKNIIDLITPVDGSKEYRKVQKQIKDAGSKKKIRWLYTDKLLACILTFFVSLGVFWGVHKVEIDYVYTEPTTDYDLIGGMSSKDEAKATEKTRRQNTILDMFRGKSKTTKAEIISAMKKSKEYKGFTDTDIETEADQIYTKLQKTESVDSFEKLQSISSNTIRYISCHSDELIAVNYYTGIRYNKQYYQPNKTLIEYNTQSYDVYENQVVVGFLRSIVNEITKIINDIQERYYTESRAIIQEGYFDSMYQIFSRSIEKINTYTAMLIDLKSQYQQLYFAFSNLLSIKGYNVTAVPEYTPVFQSISAYNQIYRMIFKWFSCGNYELGKEELLLSFISTSKIYEYYCLIKLLRHFEKINNVKFIKATNMNYHVTDDLYINTKYNNTFFYEKDDVNITIYYQPVIYSNDLAINNIFLFRNNAPNISDKTAIPYYSPDYIIKISKESNSKYIILDAKFSSPKKIREKQLEHLVFKYLFSISPLKENDSVIGLYILCGKKSGSDRLDIVHNIARKINKVVRPFVEIAIMNGFDTNDDSIPQLILKDI